MKSIVVGLGIQGHKRASVAGKDLVATVDTINTQADYKDLHQVELASFDAAFVCTPDSAKFEILEYLLSNGKHVLVEKPILAHDNAHIEKLAALSIKHGAVCYTAYNHRFEPHFVNLKNLLAQGTLGKIYLAKFFYGNGTARDVRDSAWRDQGPGVLPDLGSHLLDTMLFLFGDGLLESAPKFEPWSFNRFENKTYDHFIFGYQGSPKLELEATLLSWRNTFRADIWGENGSAHIDCLCKWGPSTLTVRGRVLPSGKPAETRSVLEFKDPTWVAEYEHFKKLVQTPGARGNLTNDIWINTVLNRLEQEAARRNMG